MFQWHCIAFPCGRSSLLLSLSMKQPNQIWSREIMSTSSRKLFPLCSAANLISLVRVLFMWQSRLRRGWLEGSQAGATQGQVAQLSSCEMTGPDTKCHLKIRAMCHCMCVRRETNSQKKRSRFCALYVCELAMQSPPSYSSLLYSYANHYTIYYYFLLSFYQIFLSLLHRK